jgi:hypothetical protein
MIEIVLETPRIVTMPRAVSGFEQLLAFGIEVRVKGKSVVAAIGSRNPHPVVGRSV